MKRDTIKNMHATIALSVKYAADLSWQLEQGAIIEIIARIVLVAYILILNRVTGKQIVVALWSR